MNVQLRADVAQMMEELTSESEYSIDEAVNLTLCVWCGLMMLCRRDPLVDALLTQFVARAAALPES